MDSRNKVFAVVGTVAIVATVGITGLALFVQKDSSANTEAMSQTTSTSNSSTSVPASSNSEATTSSTSYKDGTYTSSAVSYSVPRGGYNSLKATVVINSGKISSVTTSNEVADRESGMYVSNFEGNLSSDAVGQTIGDYSPSRISGASLTTSAFDEALTDIAAQARA